MDAGSRKIAALEPEKVVASHKNPALDDDPRAIEETRQYLEDAERLSRTSHSKAIQRAYYLDHLPSQQEVVAMAEKWRPYRSLATSYLFSAIFEEPTAAQ